MDETSNRGLHYNRFRYYDPETAQYISPDPIGLAGGDRPYGYVHNPISWVDPLGLAGCKPEKSEHALQRHSEGRPVGQTINDLQNTRPNDILRQSSDDRWVVLGANKRIHIIERNGREIVTSMSNPKQNTNMRIGRGQWERLSQSELDEFRNIFSDYVRF